MRETRILMGMPITVEIVGAGAKPADLERIFSYLKYIDNKFSTYRDSSEITKINKKRIEESEWSSDMREIFDLAEKTKKETGGYFDIKTPEGTYDPSGIVKGWAIRNAADILRKEDFRNFSIDAGGDIEVSGVNTGGEKWKVGIRNPFKVREIVKSILISEGGIATSGTYERGNHIYNPKDGKREIRGVVSLTVIGPDVYEADRFVTAAFAMGRKGIDFIERMPGLEGYLIDQSGIATMTSGFKNYAR